jgi:hypothetical protein
MVLKEKSRRRVEESRSDLSRIQQPISPCRNNALTPFGLVRNLGFGQYCDVILLLNKKAAMRKKLGLWKRERRPSVSSMEVDVC